MFYMVRNKATGLFYDHRYMKPEWTVKGRMFHSMGGLRTSIRPLLDDMLWTDLDAAERQDYLERAVKEWENRQPGRAQHDWHKLMWAKGYMWLDMKHIPLADLLPEYLELIEIDPLFYLR